MTDVIFTSEGKSDSISIITKRQCTEGCYVRKDKVLFEYRPEGAEPSSAPFKFRAPTDGVVQYKLGTTSGDRLEEGAVICTLTECPHSMVWMGRCSVCCMEVAAAEFVPTLHNMPQLRVNKEDAVAEGEKRRARCLNARKLVLLVDLDQTIIHTTNKQPTYDPKEHSDISQFQLASGISYWTKLRPHTTEFLEKMSELFEMDIFTFGERKYADAIAKIVDPSGKLFGTRILSRTESQCLRRKTKNLSALFPAGEEMVAIIDDRADVWEFSDALVQVRPYKFFNVDDINAPPSSNEKKRVENSAEALPQDSDDALIHVENVLRKVHSTFYKHYVNTGEIGDLKKIISSIREKALEGCVIVLSGIVRSDCDPRRSDAYRIATKFGARVEEKMNEDTTHVVAAKWGTQKVHEAVRRELPVVSPEWLYACLELWEKAPEQQYIITADTPAPIGPPLGSNIVLPALPKHERLSSSADKTKRHPSESTKQELGRGKPKLEKDDEAKGGVEEDLSEDDSASGEEEERIKRRRRDDGEENDHEEKDSDEDDDLDDMVAALEEQLEQ